MYQKTPICWIVPDLAVKLIQKKLYSLTERSVYVTVISESSAYLKILEIIDSDRPKLDLSLSLSLNLGIGLGLGLGLSLSLGLNLGT
jgi:hypothetical protein